MTIIPVIDEVLTGLAADKKVRRELPNGGRLYLDRRLPFICVYRRPPATEDSAAERLVSTGAAYLIAPDDRSWARSAAVLLRSLAKFQVEHFGGFLILELRIAQQDTSDVPVDELSGERLVPPPGFKVETVAGQCPQDSIDALARSLRQIKIRKQSAQVETEVVKRPASDRLPLLRKKDIKSAGCHVATVEVASIYRDPETGELFPKVLRSLRRSLARALNRAFYAYSSAHTNISPDHYHTLGRRSFAKAVWDADRQLAWIESSFDLLLQATPTNAESAWLEFRRRNFEKKPEFQYRPVTVEPTELKRRLFQVPIGRIEDATLAHLLRQKQDELDRRITMLADVGTSKFLPGSLQVYGGVGDELKQLAAALLERIPPGSRDRSAGRQMKAGEFADLAIEEVRRYRAIDPTFQAEVQVRDDIFSGLLVSGGNLLIGKKTLVPPGRVEALLQHEVGTHMVTYHNGSCQPFRQLALGLAGYDGLQEGLAVMAEYFSGGLNPRRLRLLAGRVLAVEALLDGAGFVDTFNTLFRRFGFPQRIAYTIAMRVYRGGGLTKDASYLRGLVEILSYLQGGGELEPLLSGKIAAHHIPLVKELNLRKVLRPPPLRPRYLDFPRYAECMARIRSGLQVIDLVKGTRK